MVNNSGEGLDVTGDPTAEALFKESQLRAFDEAQIARVRGIAAEGESPSAGWDVVAEPPFTTEDDDWEPLTAGHMRRARAGFED